MYDLFWILNCALQIFAAVMAVKLTKLTKWNFSWLFICAGLIVMSFRSLMQFINFLRPGLGIDVFGFDMLGDASPATPLTMGNLFVSACFALGVFMIKQMFVLLNETETRKREFEKTLLNTTIMTEENERRRFASELHDGLGPLLSSIKMGFSAIAEDISDADVRKNLELAIGEAIGTVREISNNMSPHILVNLGLKRAIVNFLGKIPFPKDLRLSYNINIGEKRYPATNEIVLYRVLCELVNNTVKHAGATAINFRIEEQDGWLCLTYKDNGTGFPPEVLTDEGRRGMGLYNIVSRVTSLKGTCNFKTGGESDVPIDPDTKEHGMVAEIRIPAED